MSEFVRIIDPSGKTLRNDLYNSPPDPASYIIFKDGGLVKAKNGRTGQIEFSDPDAAKVIRSAADAIPNGGRIVFKPGIYLINSMIETDSKAVLFEGESISYKEGYGVSAILRANATMDYVMKINGQWTSLEKLVIDGNHKASGVYLGGLDNYVFRCFVLRTSLYGIWLAGVFNQWVEDCWIEWNPIGVQATENSKIIGNHFVENDQSISISSRPDVWIINNLFRNPVTRSINLWGTPSSNVIIAFNIFECDKDSRSEFMFFSSNKQLEYVKIMGNIVNGGGLTDYFINVGS